MSLNPDPAAWAGKRVLLTGHTGFKGAWLALWLARMKASVSGFSLPPATSPNLFSLAAPGLANSTYGDIRELEAVRACMRAARPQVIFHMAAQSLVRPSYADPVGTYATNVMGTVHVLEAARACDSLEAIVVVTSDKVYENREWDKAYGETEPMGGHDPYSSSKGASELAAGAYRKSFFADTRANVASARAGNVIGGGDWAEDRLIPDLVRAFGSGRAAALRAPNSVRPWQHVLEPLAGYLLLAQRLMQPGGEAFADAWNFGPAEQDCRTVSHVADRMAARWGDGARWQQDSAPALHEAVTLKLDSTKARSRLGWQPRLDLDRAVAWTADWYLQQARGAAAKELSLAQIEAYEAAGA